MCARLGSVTRQAGRQARVSTAKTCCVLCELFESAPQLHTLSNRSNNHNKWKIKEVEDEDEEEEGEGETELNSHP